MGENRNWLYFWIICVRCAFDNISQNFIGQVLPKDLDNGDGDEWTDWRGQAVVSNGTQVIPFGMINFVSVEDH